MHYSLFAQVLLPLPLPKLFSYAVPEEMADRVQFGVRVEVPFGKNKRYSGLVVSLHESAPEAYTPKPVLAVLDDYPVIQPEQHAFWQWIARYYICTLGEVMNAALPSHLKLSSETVIQLSPLFSENFEHLAEKEYLIASALKNREELTTEEVARILGQKTILPLVRRMLEKKIIYVRESLKEKYKPKKVQCLRLAEAFADNTGLNAALDLTERSEKQTAALLAYIQLSKNKSCIRRQDLIKSAAVTAAVVKALIKKGILEVYDKNVSRIKSGHPTGSPPPLTKEQKQTLAEIKKAFQSKNTVLLHGVTGSGKTQIYIEMIRQAIAGGGQVLYMLPEIALTSQIVERLRNVFGDDVLVYHSRLNNNERVEVWQQVMAGKPIVLSARSGVFLPFKNLKLLVVDEEHDRSFKQFDPAPRYHGRDAGLVLAGMFKAKALLGTATPSTETYLNALNKKYGYVRLSQRFGDMQMPETVLVDIKKETKERKMQAHFSSVLIEEITTTLQQGRQVILFQNRRGYSPVLICEACDWRSECQNCDVALTFHKNLNYLRCHYCGFHTKLPEACPVCGTIPLKLLGFGTQKIEEELKIYFPDTRIGRMDYDTTAGKAGFEKIIHAFEMGDIEILVGTQMVTKGLDFDNVGLVGIMSADQLLNFPDFRASERAFQQMIQVSGRAGRKDSRGKVIIQAYHTEHPVLTEVLNDDFDRFMRRELKERQAFDYPPYKRLINVSIRHKKPQIVEEAAKLFTYFLEKDLKDMIVGPAWAPIPRLRNQYRMNLLIKLPKSIKKLHLVRERLEITKAKLKSEKGLSTVRVVVDVDPA